MNKMYVLLFALFVIGCAKKPVQLLPEWSEIAIRTDNQDIRIPKDTSACYSQIWAYRDSISDNGNESWRIPIKQTPVKFKLSDVEKDSLFKFITELIDIPKPPSSECSDYVGNVSFKVYYQQYSKSCSYSSVCRWQNINIQTLKISELLGAKIKLANE